MIHMRTFTKIKASELRLSLQEAFGRRIQSHGHWCPGLLYFWDDGTICGILMYINMIYYVGSCGSLLSGGDGTVVGVYMLNHVHATCGHAGRWDLHPIGTGTSPNMQLPHPDQMRFLPPGGFSIAIRDVACCCHKTRNPISVPDWIRLVDSRRQM